MTNLDDYNNNEPGAFSLSLGSQNASHPGDDLSLFRCDTKRAGSGGNMTL